MALNLGDFLKDRYSVYKLINHTKNEIYYGITNDFENRLKKHKNNEVDATKRWVFGKDKIEHKIIDSNLSKKEASEKAHRYTDMSLIDRIQYKDYRIIKTGGW